MYLVWNSFEEDVLCIVKLDEKEIELYKEKPRQVDVLAVVDRWNPGGWYFYTYDNSNEEVSELLRRIAEDEGYDPSIGLVVSTDLPGIEKFPKKYVLIKAYTESVVFEVVPKSGQTFESPGY